MHKTLWMIPLFVLALLTACSEEEMMSPEMDAVELHTRIEPLRSSRVQMAEEGAGQFSPSDRITLFVTPEGSAQPSAHALTLGPSGWTPRLTWYELQAKRADFSAVYPALAQTVPGEMVHEVAADQRAEEAYRQSDLLYAKTSASRGQQVDLNFRHQMSRVVVHLSSAPGAFTDEELAAATLTLKGYRQIVFDPHTGSFGSLNGAVETLTLHPAGKTTFHAIVCPQSIQNDWHTQGWIEIAIGGKKMMYKAPEKLDDGVAFSRLEAGKQVTFNLTLDKQEAGGGGEETDWRNKTVWVEGIQGIPPLEQWGFYLNTGPGVPHVYALEWKREYGWYDCNKKDPTGPGYDDQNLCWAATTSNLIYWWLDRNAEYVARYGYQGPHTYNSDLDCEVFQFFKDHFTDRGYFINYGLDYFFRGKIIYAAGDDARPDVSHKGFFTDVFPNTMSRVGVGGGYNLSENMKRAFRDKEAMGLGLLLNKGKNAHAITIWGAHFDDQGEVDILFVAENNDRWANEYTWPMRPGAIGNSGIFTKRVKIDQSGKAFVEGGNPGVCSLEIQNITFLGMHTEDWENYFKTH